MKRFQFKLQTVLRYRETLEGLAENAYREALLRLNQARSQRDELGARHARLLLFFNLGAGAAVDVRMLQFVNRAVGQLLELIERQRQVILSCEAVAAEKLQAWRKRRQETEVIRRLKQKRWQEYQRQVEKEDQKLQDDIFLAKKVRELHP
jgi:flagellar protein FliJ